jgi:hypothetical protein
MTATLRAVAIPVLVVFVVSGCGGSHHNGASGFVAVDADGRIGALRVDLSDRRAIIAFAGRPDAERHGRYAAMSSVGPAPYDALGYDCAANINPNSYAIPLVGGGPVCHTVFFVDARSGRLGLFYNTQPRFVERHGVHVGMPTATAEKLLQRRVIVGCINSIELGRPGRRPWLRFIFGGGTISHTHLPHLRRGHVAVLVLHSAKHDPGVFECQ